MEIRKALLYFSLKYDGDFNRIYDAIKKGDKIDYTELNQLKKELKYNYVCATETRYPEFLKKEISPSIVLFYEGNINLLKANLPYKYATLKSSGKRFLGMVDHNFNEEGAMFFEHLTMAESPKDLDFLLEHMKSKGLNFKQYKFKKELNQER